MRALLTGPRADGSQVRSLSCPSAGNCGAGGYYIPNIFAMQGLVLSERNGTWGKAQAVPGLAALNVGRNAEVDSISCPSAGHCSAGGFYSVKSANILADSEVFVVSEKNGVWGKAQEVPGTARLNTGTDAAISQITCTSPGNCLGVGYYTVKGDPNDRRPFSITEKNGKWGTARTIPGFTALGSGVIAAISCGAAGNCTGVGNTRKSGESTVFTISLKNGTWGAITPISGMAALPPDGSTNAFMSSLSCPSRGNCTAGGDYSDPARIDVTEPFVVTEKNGIWGSAQALPGVAALSSNSGVVAPSEVVCPAVGNCTTAGDYRVHGGTEVFVTTEQNGTWGTPIELPGIAALNKEHLASTPRLACGAPGNCGIGGFYTFLVGSSPSIQVVKPYLATQKNGVWSKAKEVSGIH